MRLELCCFFLLLLLRVGRSAADVLEETVREDIDPIAQTEDEAEENDQSKRFLFGDDDAIRYALEKHVRLRGGHRYLLGYRPVRLQYLPVARPLYSYQYRPSRLRGYHGQRQHARPLVSLVPPKLHPTYNKQLPVNVPSNVPQRPWEMQGWDVKPIYGPPAFAPSAPDPTPVVPPVAEPSIPVFPPAVQPTPVLPVFPPTIQPTPVLPVAPNPFQPRVPSVNVVPQPAVPAVHFVPKPVLLPRFPLPVLPVPTPVVPAPAPVFPVPQPPFVPLPAPVHPVPPPVLLQKPLVPANFLVGRHLPIPDLGVLPLGARVPVQITPQIPNLVHKQVLVHHPGVHLEGGFTPIETLAHHHHTLANVHPNPVLHQEPVFVNRPAIPNVVHQLQPGAVHQIPLQPDIATIQPSQALPPIHQPGVVQQEEPHNYFYFARRLPNYNANSVNDQLDFGQQHQEAQPQIDYDQSFQHPTQQQGRDYEQQPEFFQPGKTDVQIPQYLPQHPHLRRNDQKDEQQRLQEYEDYEEVKKR